MPVTPTYPGVYIEEISSGVRTITGVATSITAFIGRAKRGPDNEAVIINSYGDFERIFGGLWKDSSLGYTVRDFYLNGGRQAVIVRLYHAEGATDGGAAPNEKAKLKVGGLSLEAAYKGKWGEALRATVDKNVSEDVATRMGVTKNDLFNLTVRDSAPSGDTEKFLNITIVDSPRRIDKVLKGESRLVRWDGNWPPSKLPTVIAEPDTVTSKELARKEFAKSSELAALEKTLIDAEKTVPKDQSKIDAAKKAIADAKKPFDDAIDTVQKAMATSDGLSLTKADFTPNNGQDQKIGLYSLEQLFAIDSLFNILCIPPYLVSSDVDVALVAEAAAYCEYRRAILLVDPRSDWKDKTIARNQFSDPNNDNVGTKSKNAALFFPRLRQPNPLRDNQFEEFVPCGVVAGIFSRTDTNRGVWKAPAGLEATLVGVPQLSVSLTNEENGELNQLGINCLRSFPVNGRVVWGARTLRGADQLADEWKYIPVRRTALFIEESLYRGLQWVVFEPNDEPLWAQIRLNVGAFMHNLFRQGAFQGTTPRDAYFVKCDKESTTQSDINLGIVNVVVGFAPLKPAEFVIIKLQQMAGQIEV